MALVKRLEASDVFSFQPLLCVPLSRDRRAYRTFNGLYDQLSLTPFAFERYGYGDLEYGSKESWLPIANVKINANARAVMHTVMRGCTIFELPGSSDARF